MPHPTRNELLAMAADCRYLAQKTDNESVRAQLLEIAETFDREAAQAPARSSGSSAYQPRNRH